MADVFFKNFAVVYFSALSVYVGFPVDGWSSSNFLLLLFSLLLKSSSCSSNSWHPLDFSVARKTSTLTWMTLLASCWSAACFRRRMNSFLLATGSLLPLWTEEMDEQGDWPARFRCKVTDCRGNVQGTRGGRNFFFNCGTSCTAAAFPAPTGIGNMLNYLGQTRYPVTILFLYKKKKNWPDVLMRSQYYRRLASCEPRLVSGAWRDHHCCNCRLVQSPYFSYLAPPPSTNQKPSSSGNMTDT